jgi:GDP-D-mannose dehydratase
MTTALTNIPKVALITGVTGQDGSYLAELLLEKDYIVHGVKRRASSLNTSRVDHIYQDPHIDNTHFKLHYGDLTDTCSLTRLIQQVQPDEIYNLGAQSHMAVSFESPEYTAPALQVGQTIVRIDPRYFRPTEVETLLGDPTKAKQELGWVPEINAQNMCKEMVTADLSHAKQHALLKKHGYDVNVSGE